MLNCTLSTGFWPSDLTKNSPAAGPWTLKSCDHPEVYPWMTYVLLPTPEYSYTETLSPPYILYAMPMLKL